MDFIWYQNLNKPFLTPPAFVFGIVWSVLYLLITISFILYIQKEIEKKDILAIGIFVAGLILNFMWTYVFFNLHLVFLCLLMILLMIVLLIYNIFLFYKKSKMSAYLLIPYLIWLLFASYLNFEILRLN